MSKIKFLMIGAGSRGAYFSTLLTEHFQNSACAVGVAEPRAHYRNTLAEKHQMPDENVFTDWKEAADRPKFADAVIITTPDNDHVGPAVEFAKKGYAVFLEKPMAPNIDDCRRIVDAIEKNDCIFAVCHSMRYTAYTQKLKSIIDSELIGQIASIQHLEPVAYWHQAHSYVRGNWRSESETSFMLLTKSCHDIDWLCYMMGKPCVAVSSFGNLLHFRKDQKPHQAGAALRCVDCDYEPDCPYSAKKIYLGRAREGDFEWPNDVLTSDLTIEGVDQALRTGPYGRCVYECDNDVVDHQVVNMLFAPGSSQPSPGSSQPSPGSAGESGRGASVSFTMTAFTENSHRKTRIFGTKGQIEGDGRYIHILDFVTDEKQTIDTNSEKYSEFADHGGGGGDGVLLNEFIDAVTTGDRSKILTGPRETLQTHLVTFAAEQARLENRVVEIEKM